MSIKRKSLRKENRSNRNHRSDFSLGLKEKLMRYTMAMGFALAPWAVPAGAVEAAAPTALDISRVDGGVTESAGNVHNIYAGQVQGTNAVNRFSKFDLPAQHIANMHFATKGGGTEANNLFNFVNNKINIDGTVNALRSSGNGGHVYFLSKDGLTLGTNGVINAAALTIMNGVAFPDTNEKGISAIKDITTKLKQDQGKGKIEIQGKINAVDLVNIVSNYELDVKSGAEINTAAAGGKRDFTNLVNIGAVKSGLQGNLVVARSAASKGNIALVARSTAYNEDNPAIAGWLDKTGNNTAAARITVEKNTKITAAGEASIGAFAEDSSSMGTLASFGNIGQTLASVNVNGEVEGDTVSIVASASNVFNQGPENKAANAGKHLVSEILQQKLAGSNLADFQPDVVALKGQSTVTIGSEAKITATGKDVLDKEGKLEKAALNIAASSTVAVEDTIGANTTGGEKTLFGLGAMFSLAENDAKVEIKNGALVKTTNAAGSINTLANAVTSTFVTALGKADDKSQEHTAKGTFAINANFGEAKSKVEIEEGANLDSAKDVNIAANTEMSSYSMASIMNGQDVKLSSSVIYSQAKSDATVDVKGTINAANDINISAINTDGFGTWCSNNTLNEIPSSWVGMVADKSADYAGLAYTIFKLGKNTFTNDQEQKIQDAVFDANGWTAGMTLDIALLENKANVNVKGALKAGHDINIASKQKYNDLVFSTTAGSCINNENDKQTVVSAAVGYLKKDDAANVTIADAKLEAGNDINISSDAEYKWDRVNNMINTIKNELNALTLKDLRDNLANGKKIPQEVEEYYKNPSAENFNTLLQAIKKKPGFFQFGGGGLGTIFALGRLVRAAEAFANASSYVNVNVGTTVGSISGNAKDIGVAGSVAVTNYATKANVVLGSNVQLTAGNKIDINAKAKQVDANYYGSVQGIASTFGEKMNIPEKLGQFMGGMEIDLNVLPGWSSTGGDVYGGNVGVSTNDISSAVVVASGAKLDAKEVNVNSDTDLQRVLVALGGGQAGKNGISGMVTVNSGNTDSIVSVDDGATITATGKGLALNADNDALIVNVDGDITAGKVVAVGASFGLTDETFITAAGVYDNDKSYLKDRETYYKDKDKKTFTAEEKEEKLVLGAISSLLSDDQKNKLGDGNNGTINVSKLGITSTSTPKLISVGVAGTKSSNSAGQVYEGQQFVGAGSNFLPGLNELPDIRYEGGSSTKVTGAGAVEIGNLEGVTAALLEGANVNFTTGNRALDLYAYDDGLSLAVSGALALKTSSGSNSQGLNLMLAGTSAVNKIDLDTISQIKNTNIKDALSITNEAKQAQTIVAAAAPVNVDASGDDAKGFSTALNISINLIDNDVHANMEKVDVSMTNPALGNNTALQNVAFDKSTQITGGVAIDVAETTGVGVNAVYADIKNNVQANIKDSVLMNLGSLENLAAANLTEVNAAVGVGVSKGTAVVTGIWSHVKLDNDVQAVIDSSTITADSATNKAIDGEISDGKQESTSWNNQLKTLGIDPESTGLKNMVESNNLDVDVVTSTLEENAKKAEEKILKSEKSNKETYTRKKISLEKDKKTSVINAAVAVAANRGDDSRVAVGASVVDALVDNDYTANIKGSKIMAGNSAKGVINEAKNENLVVAVAAGVSIATNDSNLLSGAGSAAAVKLDNDTKAFIEDSQISAAKTDVKATNTSQSVAVAGAVNVNNATVGVGLAVATNLLDMDTIAGVYGSTLQGYNNGTTAIDVEALNSSNIKTIGASAGFSISDDTIVGAQGNIALNIGHNSTEAIIDRSYDADKKSVKSSSHINNANKIKVYAEDKNNQTAVAAGAQVTGGTVGVGLSFAINKLSDQSIKAALDHTTATVATGAKIDVETKEVMNLNTISASLGLGIKDNVVNVEGAGSITLARNKKNIAEMDGTSIEAAKNQAADAEVNVKAYEKNKIVATGDSLSMGFTIGDFTRNIATVGIGGAGIDLGSTTGAYIKNAQKLDAKDVEVNAYGQQDIYNVAVNGAGSNGIITAAGSFSINLLKDDVEAKIENSFINASDTVAVLARGNDDLLNVNGGVDIGILSPVGIGAGVAVAYNKLNGDIIAKVDNSKINALGKGSKYVKAHEYTTNDDNKITLAQRDHKGLVVDAYSDHKITDVVLSVGVNVGANVAVRAQAFGSSTNLNGKTGAYLNNTDVNKDNGNDTEGDVVVTAFDDGVLKDVGVNVSANVALGATPVAVGVNAGAAVSKTDFNRTIEAKTSNGIINAAKLIDTAGGKTYEHLVTVGALGTVSVAGGPESVSGSITASALVDSVKSGNTITADISNVQSINDGLTLKAAHDNLLNYTGVGVVIGLALADTGVSLSAQAAVGVIDEQNTINGTLDKVNITHRNTEAEDELAVTNYSEAIPDIVSVGASVALIAFEANVAVDHHSATDELLLNVVNSNIGLGHAAKNITTKAANKYVIDKNVVNVALGIGMGLGIGIGVQPVTINSSEIVNVSGSKLLADDKVTMSALEDRFIDMNDVNVALSLGAIGVTLSSVSLGGKQVTVTGTKYNGKFDNEWTNNIGEKINTATAIVNIANRNLIKDGIGKATETLNKVDAQVDKTDNANRLNVPNEVSSLSNNDYTANMGSDSVKGVAVRSLNNQVQAKDLFIASTVKDDIDVYAATGSVGGVGITGNVAKIKEEVANKVEILGGSYNVSNNASILGTVTGKTKARTLLGKINGVNVDLIYATTDIYGEGNSVVIEGATINTGNSLLVRSLHDTEYLSETNDYGLGVAGGGYLESETIDKLDNKVKIIGSVITNKAANTAATNTADKTAITGTAGAIEIAAVKMSQALAKSKYGAVQVAGGLANAAIAKINSDNEITLTDNTIKDASAFDASKNAVVDIYSRYSGFTDSYMNFGGGTVLGGGGILGTAENKGKALITASGNSFDVDKLNAHTIVTGIKDNIIAQNNANSINVGIGLGVGVNKAATTVETTSKVDFSENKFANKKVKVLDGFVDSETDENGNYFVDENGKPLLDANGNPLTKLVPHYQDVETAKTALDILAETNAKAESDITGRNATIVISVGHNAARINVTQNTVANLVGTDKETALTELSLKTKAINDMHAEAFGGGGGVISISPLSASAHSTSTVNNDVKLAGKFDVAGKATLEANQTDRVITRSETHNGGVIDVSAGEASNTRTENSHTKVTLAGAELKAEAITIDAKNDMSLNYDHEKHDYVHGVKASNGGVLAFASPAKFTNTMTELAEVNIGDNSKVESKNALHIQANTVNTIYATAVYENGGVIAESQVDARNILSYADKVNVQEGSSLKTTSSSGDIDINSVDNTILQVGSYAHAYGGIMTIAVPDTNNKTTRNNVISIGGNVTSGNNLNINAGQYADNSLAGLTATIDVMSYSGGLIPIRGRDLENSIAQHNIVVISGNTMSNAHTNLYANQGLVSINKHNIFANVYKSSVTQGQYISVSDKSDPWDVNLTSQNEVSIEGGSVIAGNNHSVDLTIGKFGEFVFLDKTALDDCTIIDEYGQKVDKTKIQARPTVTNAGNVDVSEHLQYKTVDIGAGLSKEYQDAQKLLASYKNSGDTQAYATVRAKIAALEEQMNKLGLYKTDENGNKIYLDSFKVDAVIVPEIVVSGGNVTIDTQNLVASGAKAEIKAYGSPTAKITNDSNLYMILSDVHVGDKGGVIKYNNIELNGEDLVKNNASINKINLNKNIDVKFTDIHSEAQGESIVDIKNNYDGPKEFVASFTAEDPSTKKTELVKSNIKTLPTIELADSSSIINRSGKVNIESYKGNIILNGTVNGSSITISAVNGSLYQFAGTGLVNIGADVEQQYRGYLENIAMNPDYFLDEDSYDINGTVVYRKKDYGFPTFYNGVKSDNTAGVIQGDSVYITADTININGLIQSGYAKYDAKAGMDAADTKKITQLDLKYMNSKFTDDEIIRMGNDSEFVISKGDKVYDAEADCYYYKVPVYYNPTTQKLLVPEVNSDGGNIFLTGQVVSTGNGRIVALDGVSDIIVTNKTSKDVKLYGLTTSEVKGKVTIVDTAKNEETVVTRDHVEVKDLTTGKQKSSSSISGGYTYNPAPNKRYSWVKGTDTVSRQYFSYKHEANWWGARESVNETTPGVTYTRPTQLQDAPKAEGSAITDRPGYVDYITVDVNKVVTSEYTSPKTETRWETGLYGFRKHQLMDWYKDTGYSYTFNASVSASKPIAIRFIGNNANDAVVKVDSKGSVDIHGNVGNAQYAGKVEMTSSQGGIYQDRGRILTNDVTLSAGGAMQGVKVQGGDNVSLKAVNTSNVDTTLYRDGKNYTGMLDGNAIDIDVQTKQNGTEFGTVTLHGINGSTDPAHVAQYKLTTNGSIDTNAASNEVTTITASRIDLVATNGDIGKDGKPIMVNSGDTPTSGMDSLSASVNAEARGNINLEEISGDLRLGKIYSETGDVKLAGPGSLVDALPYSVSDSGRTEDEWKALWTSIGLLEDHTYHKTTTTNTGKPVYQYVEDPAGEFKFAGVHYTKQHVKDANGNLLYYEEAESTSQAWDANRLIYAISDSIINPKPGVDLPTKVANIKARNLTLEMGDSAGLNSSQTTVYNIDEIGTFDDLHDLKELARADARDVDWNTTTGKVTISKKLPIGVMLSGNLTVSAGKANGANVEGVVNVESRRDSLMRNDLKIANITAKGDVMLRNAYGSIIDVNTDPLAAAITGRNLILDAGSKNFDGGIYMTNGKEHGFKVNISGALNATSTDDLFIKQVGSGALKLEAIASNGNISLEAYNDIISDSSVNTASYINLINKDKKLLLNSIQGSVGTEADWVRILNDEDVNEDGAKPNKKTVEVKAAKDAYIKGMSNSKIDNAPKGTLYVEDITVGVGDHSINLDSNGNINFISAKAETINAKAALAVSEAKNGNIEAKNLSVEAVTGINLAGENVSNKLENVSLYNSGETDITKAYKSVIENTGDVELKIASVGKSKAESGDFFTGDLTVTNKLANKANNVKLTGNINVEGDFTVENKEQANITNTQTGAVKTKNGDINLITNKGHVINRGKLYVQDAGNINLVAEDGGSVLSLRDGELYANQGDITLKAKAENIVYDKSLEQAEAEYFEDDNNLQNLKLVGFVINNANAFANRGEYTLKSEYGSVFNFNALSSYDSKITDNKINVATQDIIIDASKGEVYNTIDLYSDAKVTLKAKTGLDSFSYNIYGGRGVTLHATEGDVKNSSVIEALAGDIKLIADKGSVTNMVGADLVTAGGNVLLHAGGTHGNVENKGNLIAGVNADVKDSGTIILMSEHGNVINDSDFQTVIDRADGTHSDKFNKVTGQYLLDPNHAVSVAANNLTLSAREGQVINKQELLKAGGNVVLEAKVGMDNFAYNVEAGKNITLVATEGLLVNNAKLVAESGIIKLEAQKGSVVNMLHGDAIAKEGSVVMISGADHGAELQLVGTDGRKTILKDLVVATSGSTGDVHVDLNGKTAANDTILVDKYYNNGTGYVRVDEKIDVTKLSAEEQASIVTVFYQVDDSNNTKHLVTSFTAEGLTTEDITVNGVSMKGVKADVEAFRQGDLINRGNIVAGGGSVALKSEHGNIVNYDNYEMFNGVDLTEESISVGGGAPKKIEAHKGASIFAGGKIYNNMDIAARENLTISAGEGAITGQDYNHLYSFGTLTIEAAKGSINNNADLVGENGVILKAYEGITNSGDITSNGVVELLAGGVYNAEGAKNTANADLVNTGDITAKDHVRVETNIGDITLTDVDITAENGEINIQTQQGNIEYGTSEGHDYSLKAKAGENINVSTGAGFINTRVDLVAGKDIALTTLDSSEAGGYINQIGNMQAGNVTKDVDGYISGSEIGNITINAVNNISLLGEDVEAAGNITVSSKTGSVEEQIKFNAGNGIFVDAADEVIVRGSMQAQQNINVGTSYNPTSVSVNVATIASKAGDVEVVSKGAIDINEVNITAQNVEIKSVESGNIDLQHTTVWTKENIDIEATNGDVTNDGILYAHGNAGSAEDNKITLKALGAGTLTNSGYVAADGDIDFEAGKNIVNSESINSAQGHVNMNAGAAITNTNAPIYAKQDISLTANTGITNKASSLTSQQGAISLQSKGVGAVLNENGSLTAEHGAVSLMANKGNVANIASDKFAIVDITAGGAVTIQAEVSGDITNQGNINTKNGNISVTTADGKVENTGNLKVTSGVGDVEVKGSSVVNTGEVLAQGKAELLATNGDVFNSKAITAKNGLVNINANNGSVDNKGAISATGAVTLGSNADYNANNVANTGAITSGNGGISLIGTGNVSNTNADLIANGTGNVVLQSTVAGDVTNKDSIVKAENGSITLQTAQGNIDNSIEDNNEYRFVGTDTILTKNQIASIQLIGTDMYAIAEDGSLKLVEAHSINNLTATGNVLLQTDQKGNITNQAGVKSSAGAITLKTNGGSITNEGDLNAQGAVVMQATGAITNDFADLTSANAGVTVESTANGNIINVLSDIKAKGNVLVQTKTGEITNNAGNIKAENGNIILNSIDGGSILNGNSSLTAGENSTGKYNVSITTAKGEIINAGSDIVASGDVTLESKGAAVVNAGTENQVNTESDVYNLDSDIKAGGAVTLKAAAGAVRNNSSDIEAKNKVELTAAKDVNNADSVIKTEAGGVVLQSTNAGDVSNINSAITAQAGDVTLKAQAGAIENTNSAIEIVASGNVTISGTKDIYLDNSNVRAANGNVSITSNDNSYGNISLINSNLNAGTGHGGKAIINAANGNVILRDSDVRAGASIDIDSATGDISNYNVGDVVVKTDNTLDVTVDAKKNVEIISLKGNIDNYGVTKAAEENVSISAFDGYVVNHASITADGGTIRLAAYNASEDKKANKGDVSSLYNINDEATTLSAGKGVDIYAVNSLRNDSNVSVVNGDINITSVNKEIVLGDGKKATYTIQNEGNINVKAEGSITNHTSLKIGTISNVAKERKGAGNINLTSNSGSITNGNVNNTEQAELATAKGSVIMIANGNINNYGESFAGGGEIYIESLTGSVDNQDKLDEYKDTAITDMSTSNITILAKQGNLANKHNLVSGGNITLAARSGLQNYSYYMSAIGDVRLTATEGDLINNTAILSQEGSIYLTAEKGAVVNVGGEAVTDIKAYDPVTGNFYTKAIQMNKGDLYSLGGNVILSAGGDAGTTKTDAVTKVQYGSGDVVNQGSIVALGSHKVFTDGKIANQTFGAPEAAEGEARLGTSYFEPGTVGLYSANGNVINADKDYNQDGSRKNNETTLTVGGNQYLLSLGDLDMEATNGSLLNQFNIQAGGSVRAIAKDDVTFTKSGESSANNLVITNIGGDLGITSVEGEVNGEDFNMTANGNILVEGLKGVKLNTDVTSLMGSVMISSAEGSIYRGDGETYDGTVTALNGMAALGVGKGDIEVKGVYARDVVLFAPAGNINAQEVGASDLIVTEGKNVKVNKVINLNSNESGKTPAMAISGDTYTANHVGNTHFSYLNIKTGDINVQNGNLAIDVLKVKDVAHFTAYGYKVGVYGPNTLPHKDNSDAIFFDTNKGADLGDRPIPDFSDFFNFNGSHTIENFKDRFNHLGILMENMQNVAEGIKKDDTWNKDTKGWMNLYIDSGRYARSNGLLMHLRAGYEVDNNRYPQDNIARLMANTTPYGVYDLTFKDHLNLNFLRYNLVQEDDEKEEVKQNKKAETKTVLKDKNLKLTEAVMEDGSKGFKLIVEGKKEK